MVSARKTVREAIRRLDIEDGDVVLIKRSAIPGGTQTAVKAYIDSFATILGNTGREHCVVVVVRDLEDIEILDSMKMMEHGWVRLEGI